MNKFIIPIIYEDDDILAINKPAGLVVHGESPSIVDWTLKNRPKIKNIGDPSAGSGQERPGIVHRLDKDTSGVLLIAKNQKSFEFLKDQFKNRKIKKIYLALVHGNMKERDGIIDLAIGKSKSDFRKKSVQNSIGKTREAITEYKVKKVFNDHTLVEVYPRTGRMHQIRVHFKAIGHPIVCDKLYGFKKQECPFGLSRHFLHAKSLELELLFGSKIKLEADLPEELQNVLNMLN